MNLSSRIIPCLIQFACLAAFPACSDVVDEPGASEVLLETEFPDTSPLAGGQSGGETGSMPASFDTAACVCFAREPALARVVISDASCARLELVSKPVGAQAYAGLEAGDLFGGLLRTRCSASDLPAEGALVAVEFFPGLQTSLSCDAFNQCISDQCEAPLFAGDTSAEDQARIINAWEQCMSACTASTSEACSANAGVARFNGTVQVVELAEDETVTHEVSGEQRVLSLADISAPGCSVSLGGQATTVANAASSGLASGAASSGQAPDSDSAFVPGVPGFPIDPDDVLAPAAPSGEPTLCPVP